MFTNNFDPVAFSLFAFEVRWYSLSYIFGILFGWFYCKRFLIKDKVISTLFDDLLTYLIIGIIIGGTILIMTIFTRVRSENKMIKSALIEQEEY